MACISKMQEAGQTRIWGNQILRIKTGDSFFCNNARKNTLIIDIKQHTHRHTHRHRHTHTHTQRHTKHTHKQSTIQPNYNKIRLCGTFDPQYTFKYIEEN